MPITSVSSGQAIQTLTPEEEESLRQVFRGANRFSIKGGELPHHKAYTIELDSGAESLVGFVFLTFDIEPDEIAYNGRIRILVGMTTEGVLTGIKVVRHREPYGYSSIQRRNFSPQFEGKSILERFWVGRDVDAVTGATITVKGAARVIRKSARKIAKRYISQEP